MHSTSGERWYRAAVRRLIKGTAHGLFGIGMALAVLMDAFVIRATLVPAFMRLAGEVNWWSPAWLRRVYERVGVPEVPETEPDPRVDEHTTRREPVSSR